MSFSSRPHIASRFYIKQVEQRDQSKQWSISLNGSDYVPGMVFSEEAEEGQEEQWGSACYQQDFLEEPNHDQELPVHLSDPSESPTASPVSPSEQQPSKPEPAHGLIM